MNTQLISSTRHFHFRSLRPGVYAALARPEGLAASNCGIVDLGGRTVVIDTSLSPQAGIDLRNAALELTGHDVNLVLLTHHHFDHIGGCQVFDQTTSIFSSAETYKMLVQTGAESLAHSRENSLQVLHDRQDNLRSEKDTDKQEEILKSIQAVKERLAVTNATRLRMPDLTSQGPAAVYGTSRWLEFIPFPKAHCPGNAIISLPQEGVIFVGDLLFARQHPFMSDGDPQGWLEALDRIETMQPELIVPGHGGTSSLEEVHILAEYIHVITQTVQEFVQAGKPAQALGEIRLPEPFAWWEPKDFLAGSLALLYDRFTETGYSQNRMF